MLRRIAQSPQLQTAVRTAADALKPAGASQPQLTGDGPLAGLAARNPRPVSTVAQPTETKMVDGEARVTSPGHVQFQPSAQDLLNNPRLAPALGHSPVASREGAVDRALAALGRRRTLAAVVSHHLVVAPILLRSTILCTLAEQLARPIATAFGLALCPLPPGLELPAQPTMILQDGQASAPPLPAQSTMILPDGAAKPGELPPQPTVILADGTPSTPALRAPPSAATVGVVAPILSPDGRLIDPNTGEVLSPPPYTPVRSTLGKDVLIGVIDVATDREASIDEIVKG